MSAVAAPPDAAIIILAAGSSKRMGGRNKLLLNWEPGRSVVRQVAENAVAAGVPTVIVVTGYEADRVAEVLDGCDLRLVHNPDYRDGLAGSLRTGIDAAAEAGASGALVLLGDMPLTGPDAIEAVLEAAARDQNRIVQPVAGGKPAHPVWLPIRLADDIAALRGDQGARRLIATDAHPATTIEVGRSATVDLDTEDAYRAALAGRDNPS